MNRLDTANIAVLNHNAQDYPELYGQGKRSLFDRVLCDVPCSSVAAIRKMPQRWASWSPKKSHSLHQLQLQILCRGLEVLKVGGRISYSTCSLSPIENEAVVAAALKRYGDRIRIIETELPGFQFQQGLSGWSVMTVKS
jgi:multisite-specific tRNA:(cytosine-C5)-methyltransferase